MLFRLVRLVLRKDSRVPYLVKRIPADLKPQIGGLQLTIPLGASFHHITLRANQNDLRFSLRTHDVNEAKARHAAAVAYLEKVWNGLRRDQPVALTHRQATALAGKLYRAWADEYGESTVAVEQVPGKGWQRVRVSAEEESAYWKAAKRHLEALHDADDTAALEQALGPIVDRLLLAEGIRKVDEATRETLLSTFWKALRDAFASRTRQSDGDYSPDATVLRFPDWEPIAPSAAAPKRGKRLSLKGLLQDWWNEANAAGRKPSTFHSYSHTVNSFVRFLGHDDAASVTKADVVRFKEHRLKSTNPKTGRVISAKTVKDSDLAALKTVLGWAKANGMLTNNVAEGVTIKLGRALRTRSKGFTDAEAIAILKASRSLQRGGESPQTFAAKKWVPWLCAYTGARVGELAQVRREDVRQDGSHWVLTITPEAGTVKTNEARDVVLHPDLLALGFHEFVLSSPSGHLFLRAAPDGDVLGPLRGLKNRLAAFARVIVTDKRVAPNHAWRHRFKTVGLEAGIEHRTLDAMQGQRARNVAETYGEVTLNAQAIALAKLPSYLAACSSG